MIYRIYTYKYISCILIYPLDYSQWSKSRGCKKKTQRFNASNPPGPAAAKASDHLRCHLLCTGRFHTRWDDEGFIPHSHWRSRCLGDQLALYPPCSTPLQLQDSNIYLCILYLYRLPILVYYFPGLFQMYLYVVLRSILRVFGYLWIFRFITWMLQVPRPMMPIVVMPQMVQPVPLRRPPPPTVVQQALFCFNIFLCERLV